MLSPTTTLRNIQPTLLDNLILFVPELVVTSAIVLVLLLRLFRFTEKTHLLSVAIVAAAIALAAALAQSLGDGSAGPIFTSLLNFDHWAYAGRVLVLTATLLTLLISRLTGLPDREDSADYSVLMLGATLGLMLMCSANHLLMIFLAIEMASLPSYALAGFLKGRGTGSEAALKYAIYGAAASGIMLYGISMLTAITGSGVLNSFIIEKLIQPDHDFTAIAGLFFVAIGLAYKLSIAPMHVWLPDAFEGAPAEVGGFLSVASKAAALILLARLLMLLPGKEWREPIAYAGAITVTFGNLLAYAQTNLKRLLGYSTIAHAGMLLTAAAMEDKAGLSATLVYLAAYILANLGAFATVAAVRNAQGDEDIKSLGGLFSYSPVLGVGFALCLLSLLGLPPLAGFAGKFLIFSAVWPVSKIVFVILVLNTGLAAGYYLRLLRIMVLDETTVQPTAELPRGLPGLTLLLALAGVALGIAWTPLIEWARVAAAAL